MSNSKKRIVDFQVTVTWIEISDPEQRAAATARWYSSMGMLLTLLERFEAQEAKKVSQVQISTKS